MLTRYLQGTDGVINAGNAEWDFPPLPMGLAAQVSMSIPKAPQTSTWTVNLNGQAIGGMSGTTPFGPLYILPNDSLTITGASTAPAPQAVLVGLQGPVAEVPPIPPLIGGGTAQSMTVNADELQGVPISATLPSTNQGLVFNGTDWTPEAIVNQLLAGNGISLSPSGGTGDVTVTNNIAAGTGITITGTNPLTIATSGSTITHSFTTLGSNQLISNSNVQLLGFTGLTAGGTYLATGQVLYSVGVSDNFDVWFDTSGTGGTAIGGTTVTIPSANQYQDIFVQVIFTGTTAIYLYTKSANPHASGNDVLASSVIVGTPATNLALLRLS